MITASAMPAVGQTAPPLPSEEEVLGLPRLKFEERKECRNAVNGGAMRCWDDKSGFFTIVELSKDVSVLYVVEDDLLYEEDFETEGSLNAYRLAQFIAKHRGIACEQNADAAGPTQRVRAAQTRQESDAIVEETNRRSVAALENAKRNEAIRREAVRLGYLDRDVLDYEDQSAYGDAMRARYDA